MKTLIVLVLSIVMVGCVATGSPGTDTPPARIKAAAAWYCGPGLFGIRAIARASLAMVGVPIPDACKLGAAIIADAEDEEIDLSNDGEIEAEEVQDNGQND